MEAARSQDTLHPHALTDLPLPSPSPPQDADEHHNHHKPANHFLHHGSAIVSKKMFASGWLSSLFMSPHVDPDVNNIEFPCSGDSEDGNTALAREIDEWAKSFAQTCAAPGEKDSRNASRIKGNLSQRDRKFADNLETELAGGEVPAKSKTTQRMLREISPAEQQHHKEFSMKDKAAFRSEWSKKVMGNVVEGTEVLPSRMLAIQGDTDAERTRWRNACAWSTNGRGGIPWASASSSWASACT